MKKTSAIILIFIIIFGIVLRCYNLNFPSIGYHNFAENENLSIAEEMRRTSDFLTKRVYFHNGFSPNPIYNNAKPALVAYQILLAWQIFGENLWSARLINILFGVLSIILVFSISRKLFKNEEVALFSAFVFSILPVNIFFSRNIQSESPALFFMLSGTLLYLKFYEKLKNYYILFTGFCFFISWLYAHNFIIGLLACAFILPYNYIFSGRFNLVKFWISFILPYLFLLLYVLWAKFNNLNFDWKFSPFFFTRFLSLNEYFQIITWYATVENFTSLFIFISFAGVILAFFKRQSLLDYYLIATILVLFLYLFLFSEFIANNNFAQMPFSLGVCIGASYFTLFISQELKKFFRNYSFIVVAILLGIISLPLCVSATLRLYNTVYFGADVAGETIKELTSPNQRFFLFTYPQGNAIARYASRYCGWPKNLEEFKKIEASYSANLVCIYPADHFLILQEQFPDIAEYLRKHYHLREIGLLENSAKIRYFILQKGEDPAKSIDKYFKNELEGELKLRTIYRLAGNYMFFYTIRT